MTVAAYRGGVWICAQFVRPDITQSWMTEA